MLKKIDLTLIFICAAPLIVLALVFLAGYILLYCLLRLIIILCKGNSRKFKTKINDIKYKTHRPNLWLKHA
jgi:hypothetical protein